MTSTTTSVTDTAIRLTGSLAATLVAYGAYRVARLVYGELTSPLRNLPGPESPSFIYGNFKEIWEAENSAMHEKWVAEHGKTIKYKALFGMTRLYTMDTKAIAHVLTNSYTYQKPGPARYTLSRVVGDGVLVVEEDKHKHQRRIMNPAFGPAQIRELTEIFVEKSNELRDVWLDQIKETGNNRINVLHWLSKMTLDVIGLAGFNYSFDNLNSKGEHNELNKAFEAMFQTQNTLPILSILAGFFPILRILPMDREKEVRHAKATMNRIGHQLIRESKASIHDKSRGRDLLTLLVKANMSTDLQEHQRLSDEDVLAQVPTFLVAGHETTSNAVTWAIFALTQDIRVQSKLRDELLAVDTDTPTMDQLNALPYLDMVVRETLRIHAPVPSTIRVAVKDDILPLSEPFTDRQGKVHYEIKVKKGQTVFIPILALHRSKELWGEDASDFRPERWEHIPEGASTIPGVWSNLLTFLGGPRACIGYRFSLIEIKALLFSLVRAFEFELAVPAADVQKKSSVVQRPALRSDPKGGNQLPVIVKPYSRA